MLYTCNINWLTAIKKIVVNWHCFKKVDGNSFSLSQYSTSILNECASTTKIRLYFHRKCLDEHDTWNVFLLVEFYITHLAGKKERKSFSKCYIYTNVSRYFLEAKLFLVWIINSNMQLHKNHMNAIRNGSSMYIVINYTLLYTESDRISNEKKNKNRLEWKRKILYLC